MMVEEYRRIFPVSFRTKDEAYEHLKYIFCEVLKLHGYKNTKVTVSKEPWEDGFTVKFKWEIQTNADRIRAMTDEKLAEIMAHGNCGYCKIHDYCFSQKGVDCDEAWLNWLRKEAR